MAVQEHHVHTAGMPAAGGGRNVSPPLVVAWHPLKLSRRGLGAGKEHIGRQGVGGLCDIDAARFRYVVKVDCQEAAAGPGQHPRTARIAFMIPSGSSP